MIIAIDGGACTGKSTIARFLAEKMNYSHINSGIFFRQISLLMLNNNINADNYALSLDKIKVILERYNFSSNMMTDNELKSQVVGDFGAILAQMPIVRKKVSDELHSVASQKNVIIDGRDIGTMEFPNADFKFYFVVDIQERAKRLAKERKIEETEENFRNCQDELQKRDNEDMHRENSPLCMASDAIEIDGTNMSINEIVEKLYEIICN